MALTVATVETAIEALISGSQSVSVDGMSYTKANLKTLWDMRTKLKQEAGHAFGFKMRTMIPPEH